MVWVDPAMWRAVIAKQPALASERLVAGWASAGWPVIRRRAVCHDDSTFAPLGLPLPPALGKRRVSLRVPLDAIVGDAPVPLLAEAALAAPAAWRDTIAALLDIDNEVRCFGSLVWQYLTGLDYVTGTSDLDLL